MAQVFPELDSYEDGLYSGEFLCAYSLLQHLLDFSLADSVAVLTRSATFQWLVDREVSAPGSRASWSDLLKVLEIRDALDALEPQLIGWERPKWKGRTDPVMTVRTWSRERGFPLPSGVSVVAFFHPRRIHRDPQTARDIPIVRRCHRVITVWFALAGYQRMRRDSLQSTEMPTVVRNAGNDWNVAGRWPLPFLEAVELIEGGVDEKSSGPQFPEYAATCLRALHLDDSPRCFSQDEQGRPYCERDGRSRMAKLAALIALRSLRAENGHMKPWDAGLEEYRQMQSVGALFPGALDMGQLNGKALAVAFAGKFWTEWLGATKQRALIESGEGSPGEQARMLACCARLAHYTLEDMPTDDRTLEALMWAVSKYAHETLGVDPRLEIASHLLQAARNEPALHTLKPYYRDHFFHAVEVCFLGHLLLDMEYAEGKPLVRLFQRLMKLRSRQEVLRAWYVAALLHDVGYAIDVLKSAGEMMKFFECSNSLKDVTAGIGNVIEELSDKLKKDFPDAEAPGRDHGVVAAGHLKHLVETVTEGTGPARIYAHSIHAIAVHNSHTQTVVFKRHPLAFLLVLCDTIQEWNRPHLRFSTAPTEILASMMAGLSGGVAEVTGPLERVRVNLSREGLRLRMANRRQLEFTLEYAADIQKNCGVINLWLDSCSNLQRLRLHGLPFNIRLKYRTPPFRNNQGDVEQHMHRLKEAAEETHMSFLHGWFPKGAANKAVLHGVDEDGRERLELNLRELAKEKRVRANMEAVRERLSKWRRYNEDRDFVGDYAPMNPGFPFNRKSPKL